VSWIAINDFRGPHFWQADQSRLLPTSDPDRVVARATMILEGQFDAADHSDLQLIRFDQIDGWERHFSIICTRQGHVVMNVVQGASRSHVLIENAAPPAGARFRLTYCWDGPARSGWLTTENLDTGKMNATLIPDPVPLPSRDLHALIGGDRSVYVDPDMSLFALSDSCEDPTLNPGICARTPVQTEDGLVPAEGLCVGDMILTEHSGFQPIVAIRFRDVPAAGFFTPITLRAPYFGLSHDVAVAQHQKFPVTGSIAEYLFGPQDVIVEARHLLGHPAVQLAPFTRTVRYFDISLAQNDCIDLAGVWSQSVAKFRPATNKRQAKRNVLLLGKAAKNRLLLRKERVLTSYETSSLLSEMSA
jgi:hypothetical protein